MELLIWKSIGLAVLLLISLLFGSLPLLIIKRITAMIDPTKRIFYQRIVSFISCFGGGVFIATCLLDLFPEVNSQMITAFEKMNVKTTFPCSEFLMIIGFLLVLIFEQVALTWKENNPELMSIMSPHHHDQDEHFYTSTDNRRMSEGSLNGVSDEIQGHSVHEDHNSHSSFRTTLLVLALSLHSVFEGLAIGFQSEVEQIVQVLSAVLIHKSIIAFTLGLNLVQSRLRRNTIIQSVVVFAIMSPIGMGIGMAVLDLDKGPEVFLVSGILQGLACGTFLYVTFFEVLPHELNLGVDRLLKLFFVMFGFAIVSILIMVLPS